LLQLFIELFIDNIKLLWSFSFLNILLISEKVSSIGLNSGEYAGVYSKLILFNLQYFFKSIEWCVLRLSCKIDRFKNTFLFLIKMY